MAEHHWGVTDVTIRYIAGGRTWEVSMDPEKIDILVFNWERYRTIAEHIGTPVTKDRHILPDGRSVTGESAEAVAKAMGLRGPPRDVGPAEPGTTDQPICLHSEDCSWWCVHPDHNH